MGSRCGKRCKGYCDYGRLYASNLNHGFGYGWGAHYGYADLSYYSRRYYAYGSCYNSCCSYRPCCGYNWY